MPSSTTAEDMSAVNTPDLNTPDFLPNEHPGQMLREDFLEPLGITPYKLAKGTGLTPTHVADIISGKRNITAFTSVLLGAFFDLSPLFWLNIQNHYDLIEIRRKSATKLARVRPFRQMTAEAA